nr:MAG TPA: hypothetical protein [Caudoviricetes sp.]DAR47980.1 MAG TPA: hypothetical protein [Caudoviricetes sp.]
MSYSICSCLFTTILSIKNNFSSSVKLSRYCKLCPFWR